jgi:iron complex transport system substrate-binding protein
LILVLYAIAMLICSRMRILLVSFLLAGHLWAAPSRIVSTVPGLTEILFALGLEARVVGVSDYCRYPAAATAKPKVGSFLQPNIETITALRPDLVYIIRNPVRLGARIASMGLRVEEVNLETVDGILAAIETIGAQTGKVQQAAALRTSLTQRMAALRQKTAKLPKPSAMFFVGRTPQRLEGLIAVGPGSYLDELLRAAGATNSLADAGNSYPKISIEQILARDPETLFDMGDSAHEGAAAGKHREDVLQLWGTLAKLRAVRQKRVFALDSDIFVVPGPRFADAAEELFRMLHPPGSAPR